ncbi:MAG TPA: LysE family translocator [Pseudolabrys sp.]|nr:LysE family translocator [Pseudolabrys sp.]
MPFDVFLALAVFASVTAFTPGPNNIMLAASGVNFGFMRTIPHMIGITIGFVVLLIVCAAGLGVLVTTVPALLIALKTACGLYMLWLAWKVATANTTGDDEKAPGQPLTLFQAAAFQWVNPKALVVSLSAIAIYVRPENRMFDFLILLAVFTTTTAGSVVTWAGFGVGLRRFLKDPVHARTFNVAMALLLVASIIPIVTGAE